MPLGHGAEKSGVFHIHKPIDSHARLGQKSKIMKTQIDVKSAIVGLILGAGIMFTIGAASTSPVGRYQITAFGNGTGGGAAYLVDTKTGEVWGADNHNDWAPKADKFWGEKTE